MNSTHEGRAAMQYVRIFTGTDGRSRFEGVEVPAATTMHGGSIAGAPNPLRGMVFARLAPGTSVR